jgi:hypothetical protein
MREVLLKIVETKPAGREWSAELWSGFPGSNGAAKLAGGAVSFTQVELEAPSADGTRLDHDSVLDKIRNQDAADPTFQKIGLRLYDKASEWGGYQLRVWPASKAHSRIAPSRRTSRPVRTDGPRCAGPSAHRGHC